MRQRHGSQKDTGLGVFVGILFHFRAWLPLSPDLFLQPVGCVQQG